MKKFEWGMNKLYILLSNSQQMCKIKNKILCKIFMSANVQGFAACKAAKSNVSKCEKFRNKKIKLKIRKLYKTVSF